MPALQALFAFCLILASAYLAGIRAATIFVNDKEQIFEIHVIAVGIGLGIITIVVTFLALSHLLYPLIVLVIIIAILTFNVVCTKNFPRLRYLWFWWEGMNLFERFLAITGSIFIIFRILKASVPTWSSDACLYHLTIPKYFLEHHGIVNIPDIIHSNMTGLYGEIDFMFGYLIAGNPGANAMGPVWCFMGFIALCVLGSQKGGNSRDGLLSGILYVSLPVVFWNSDWQLVDIAATAWSIYFILAIQIWDRFPKRIPWIPALFAGLMVGTKLTTVFLAVFGFAWILLIIGKPERKSVFYVLLPSLVCFICIACIWYIKNWWYTGNPIFPFFFGGTWSPSYLQISKSGTYYSVNAYSIEYWKRLFEVFLNRGEYGPYIAFSIPIILTNWRILKRFAWVIILFLFGLLPLSIVCQPFVVPRYLLPYGSFLLLPVSAALYGFFSKPQWQHLALGKVLLIAPIIALLIIEVASFKEWKVTVGIKSKVEFYEEKIPGYAAIDYANRVISSQRKMLYIGWNQFLLNGFPISGTEVQGYVDYTGYDNYTAFEKRLYELDIKHILFEYGAYTGSKLLNLQESYTLPLVIARRKISELMQALALSNDWEKDFKDSYSVIYSRKGKSQRFF